jgi:hypothetical protein
MRALNARGLFLNIPNSLKKAFSDLKGLSS